MPIQTPSIQWWSFPNPMLDAFYMHILHGFLGIFLQKANYLPCIVIICELLIIFIECPIVLTFLWFYGQSKVEWGYDILRKRFMKHQSLIGVETEDGYCEMTRSSLIGIITTDPREKGKTRSYLVIKVFPSTKKFIRWKRLKTWSWFWRAMSTFSFRGPKKLLLIYWCTLCIFLLVINCLST